MELLYWFESIRTPVLDTVMSLVTRLGEETFFMIAALFVFWCWDKRRGYYLLAVGFAGTPGQPVAEDRLPGAPALGDRPGLHHRGIRPGGGHGLQLPQRPHPVRRGVLGRHRPLHTGRLWVRVVCIVLALLVAVSRMYLGVHTPADVGVSLLISLVLVLALYPLLESTLWFPNRMYAIIGVMLALSLAFVGYMELLTQPPVGSSEVLLEAYENWAEARNNAYTMAGAVAGVLVVYAFDTKLLQFPTRAPWWGQLIKLAGGLALVLAVRVLLREPLLALCGGHPVARSLRYFLMVLVAGCLWPMTFQFFEKHAK